MEKSERTLSPITATFLVVSTMIGTGVFTTTGFMIKDLNSPLAIIFSWLLGGVLALCGALSYAELIAIMPRNGGEYNILSKIYNNGIGFVSAWVSLIVGFAASIASSSLAFGYYLNSIFPVNTKLVGILLIIILSIIHTLKTEVGTKFQDLFTFIKILLILFFIIGGILFGHYTPSSLTVSDFNIILSPTFAIGLVFVSYSYSGWEAAGYIAGEVKNPEKSIPLALISGTLIVTFLYIALNFIYLYMIPYQSLSGETEIANITAKNLFGNTGGILMSSVISFGLISAIGAMILSGSRMYQVVGEDYQKLAFFARKNKNNVPANSIYFQSIIAIIMILLANIDELIKYIGFTLSIFAGLAVFGVIVMRFKAPEIKRNYKTFGYPLTPIFFVLLSIWMIVYSIIDEPKVSITGFATIIIGAILYYIFRNKKLDKRD